MSQENVEIVPCLIEAVNRGTIEAEHLTRRLVRQLERLGQSVTLTPSTAEAG